MFRRKDNEPPRPAGTPERAPEPTFTRPVTEAKPATTSEMPRRPLDLPGAGAPAAATPSPTSTPTFEAKPVATTVDSSKRLIVGQGISLSGEITACDRLVVEGSVQVTLNQTRAIEITETGEFTNGKAEVEEAEISGIYEGELTVRNRLLIRSTGRVKGTVRFGEIEVERGGRITGSISMLEGTEA
ncbi:MAG TPA: polymer-forming cytoskeletal protein [Geminicoccaceae bacterium]|nr:polymer-forming cytoskeletal protein [Geminicoccus sp.]HMU50635.1 polymer-forming cytoskeletal protein [Geminicoccaceae bacterium]